MEFVHGTSSAHLELIREAGLRPPELTRNSSEKRTERLDTIHFFEKSDAEFAGAYALRAVERWGGDPVVIWGEVPDAATTLAISGKGRFPDIFTAPYVPSDCIKNITTVAITDMGAAFKSHK